MQQMTHIESGAALDVGPCIDVLEGRTTYPASGMRFVVSRETLHELHMLLMGRLPKLRVGATRVVLAGVEAPEAMVAWWRDIVPRDSLVVRIHWAEVQDCQTSTLPSCNPTRDRASDTSNTRISSSGKVLLTPQKV